MVVRISGIIHRDLICLYSCLIVLAGRVIREAHEEQEDPAGERRFFLAWISFAEGSS